MPPLSYEGLMLQNRSGTSQIKDGGYKLVSFDVRVLFTNVPLKRTLNIILSRIYKDKLIQTTLKKATLKKLILDMPQDSLSI